MILLQQTIAAQPTNYGLLVMLIIGGAFIMSMFAGRKSAKKLDLESLDQRLKNVESKIYGGGTAR